MDWVYLELCWNLRSRRWLSLILSLVISFTLIELWQPKILFAVDLINLRIFDLKMLSVSELWMLESSLIYSVMVDGKYEFLKSCCFTLIWGILCAFLVLHWQFDCGIISKKIFRALVFVYLKRETFSIPAPLLKGL